MTYAEVAVDAPAGYGRTFTYSIPEGMDLSPGHLVRVPFGPRTLQGVVFELAAVPQVPQTRDVAAPVYPEPVVDAQRLDLARWVSDYYMSGLFEAVAPMLPPGSRSKPPTYLTLDPDADGEAIAGLSDSHAKVLDYIGARTTVNQDRLLAVFGDKSRRIVDRLVKAGAVRRSVGRDRPKVSPLMVEMVRLASGADADSPAYEDLACRAPRQSELVRYLSTIRTPMKIAEARREYGAGAVKSLLSKGWVETQTERVDRDPLAGRSFDTAPALALTAAQAAAAARIREALQNASSSPRGFLLHGVTGSGKTEVYLDAVARCASLGKRAIVLVPEIALTHQTVRRFASRFPGRVAVLHSGLTDGQRFDQWWKIKNGEYDVVIGSRGAVFAPQPNLGLIVLDEEHEWTYKQAEPNPRYHAGDVAFRLAEATGAVTLLGSASPEVGSYFNARKRVTGLLELPERLSGGPLEQGRTPSVRSLPEVTVIDMSAELKKGNTGMFSAALASAMKEAIDSDDQVMLFLNRRGSGSFLQCRACGESVRCGGCGVAMTFHAGADRMVCHHCGYRRRRPETCAQCQSGRLSLYGIGTEAVVREVEAKFPGVPVIRWDRDTVRRSGDGERLMEEFESGRAQVLVGTQMIAKGLHFPAVALVGVVLADVGLNVPDFRSGERTFQLLCQVAGRAGRGDVDGKVIVQTYQPDHYAVRAAAVQDYFKFYVQEMAYRRDHGNPPFANLIRLAFAHTNRAYSERSALELAERLRLARDTWAYDDTEVLGPTPAYPPRLRGRYGWQIILKGVDPRRLLDTTKIPHGWVADVDPIHVS